MKFARPLALSALLAFGCSGEPTPPAASSSTGAAVASASTPARSAPDTEGFVPIHADELEFYAIGKGEAGSVGMKETDGVISFTGNVRNYAYTKRTYGNFTLRFDYRWPTAADLPEAERPEVNTGVLVYITGEHKIWPKCLEVQGKWSEMAHIKSNAKDVTVTVRDDPAAREQARKPVGEWNTVEIVSRNGALTSTLNGVKIADSDPTELREGPIGLQAERFDVDFRNVRIREE